MFGLACPGIDLSGVFGFIDGLLALISAGILAIGITLVGLTVLACLALGVVARRGLTGR